MNRFCGGFVCVFTGFSQHNTLTGVVFQETGYLLCLGFAVNRFRPQNLCLFIKYWIIVWGTCAVIQVCTHSQVLWERYSVCASACLCVIVLCDSYFASNEISTLTDESRYRSRCFTCLIQSIHLANIPQLKGIGANGHSCGWSHAVTEQWVACSSCPEGHWTCPADKLTTKRTF